jgi:hypothetical protein
MGGSSTFTFALPKRQSAAPEAVETTRQKQLTVKQLKSYPAAERTITLPEPTSQGKVQVAQGRDGPFGMHYKIYGRGPARILVCWGFLARFGTPRGLKICKLEPVQADESC